MIFKLNLTERAFEDLERLDQKIAQLIVSKLEDYEASSNPLKFSKPLHGDMRGLFRFRIGNYRAIFRKEPSGELIILLILTIKNRNEVYD